jgi:hypothetical protein
MLTPLVNFADRDVLPAAAGRFRGRHAFRRGFNLRLTPHHPLSLIASQQPDMLIMLSTTPGSAGTTTHTDAH